MMSVRLDRILNRLAAQRAPHLLTQTWPTDKLARLLAEHDLLVLTAAIPQALVHEKDQIVQQWVGGYARFYNLITQKFFSTVSYQHAYDTDGHNPPIIVFEGQATAVIETMAGFVVPYIAARQKQNVLDSELKMVMDAVLEEELLIDDLPRAEYKQLVQDCSNVIRQLLALPVYHTALTAFDRQIIQTMPEKPPSLPTRPATLPTNGDKPKTEPKPLETLPPELERIEDTDTKPTTPTEQLFTQTIPINPAPAPRTATRRPPVPDLPKPKDS